MYTFYQYLFKLMNLPNEEIAIASSYFCVCNMDHILKDKGKNYRRNKKNNLCLLPIKIKKIIHLCISSPKTLNNAAKYNILMLL